MSLLIQLIGGLKHASQLNIIGISANPVIIVVLGVFTTQI